MKTPKRICFYGGPGVGKSTMAQDLFGDLKKTGLRVEYAFEHVKSWYFDGRDIDGWDQTYLLGRQIQYSHKPLKKGSDLVVEESPPELNSWYASYFGNEAADSLQDIAWEYSKVYPTLHVLVERNDDFYDSFGRFQDIEDAKAIDRGVEAMLKERIGDGNYHSVNPKNYDGFLVEIKRLLGIKHFTH